MCGCSIRVGGALRRAYTLALTGWRKSSKMVSTSACICNEIAKMATGQCFCPQRESQQVIVFPPDVLGNYISFTYVLGTLQTVDFVIDPRASESVHKPLKSMFFILYSSMVFLD